MACGHHCVLMALMLLGVISRGDLHEVELHEASPETCLRGQTRALCRVLNNASKSRLLRFYDQVQCRHLQRDVAARTVEALESDHVCLIRFSSDSYTHWVLAVGLMYADDKPHSLLVLDPLMEGIPLTPWNALLEHWAAKSCATPTPAGQKKPLLRRWCKSVCVAAVVRQFSCLEQQVPSLFLFSLLCTLCAWCWLLKPHSGAVAACPFFERSVMHPYHLSSFRYRRLLAAVMTLPAMDTSTPVPHEFSGQWPCCFNGCAEAGRYVHAFKAMHGAATAMVLEWPMRLCRWLSQSVSAQRQHGKHFARWGAPVGFGLCTAGWYCCSNTGLLKMLSWPFCCERKEKSLSK